jgi:hypothetical protein
MKLHALRNDRTQALKALQEHAATGARYMWHCELLYNPNVGSIRDTPEFGAIISKIEADMAEQLARIPELKRNGELEPIPEQTPESLMSFTGELRRVL